MPWKKSSPETIQRFDAIAAVPGATRAVLFGCPVWSFAGERYATLYEERVALRLAPEDRARVLAMGGGVFEPLPGRPSKDRVTLPDAVVADAEALRGWIGRAARYAGAP
jgi:hypothetical protein